MKKFLIILVLVLLCTCARAQRIDSTYNSNMLINIKDVQVDKRDTVESKSQIIFLVNNQVSITRNHKTLILTAEEQVDKIVDGTRVLYSYTATIDNKFVILGLRFDSGKLVSVAIFNDPSLSIMVIQKPTNTL